MADELDPARLVVRVRRMADLSQRDLAAVLGVSSSTVARIETGAAMPSLACFQRILALAGCRLSVVDASGEELVPVSDDALRDNAGRRFPAHLDADPPDEVPTLRRLMPRHDRPPAKGWYRHRAKRDRRRVAEGTPVDHPTYGEIAADAQRERFRRRRLQLLLAKEVPPAPECLCDAACWLGEECVGDCQCQCEPRTRGA